MALFAECPVCHQPLRWTYMLRPLWAQWSCGSCGSLLGIDRKRRLLLIVLFMGIAIGVMWLAQLAGWGELIALGMILAVWLPYFLLLDRAMVLERYGLRCKQCGYDLRGQVVPRCPECGRELDAAERAVLEDPTIATTPPRPRRRFRIAAAVLVSILVLNGLTLGLWHYYAVRARPAAGGAAPPSPTATSAVQAAAQQPTEDVRPATRPNEKRVGADPVP